MAELVSEVEAGDRAQREAAAEAERALREMVEASERAVTAVFDQVDSVTSEVLQAAGYYRHHGGEWRRARRG